MGIGNTPTSVGKTPAESKAMAMQVETPPRAWGRPEVNNAKMVGLEKHPHERGEDGFGAVVNGDAVETPPRAWGRLRTAQKNTRSRRETPPRAWGRLNYQASVEGVLRNTPTSVGKTAVNLVYGSR